MSFTCIIHALTLHALSLKRKQNGLNHKVQWQGQHIQRSYSISPDFSAPPSSCQLQCQVGGNRVAASPALPSVCNDTQRNSPLLKIRQISPQNFLWHLSSVPLTNPLTHRMSHLGQVLEPTHCSGRGDAHERHRAASGIPTARGATAQIARPTQQKGQSGCCGDSDNVHQGNYKEM